LYRYCTAIGGGEGGGGQHCNDVMWMWGGAEHCTHVTRTLLRFCSYLAVGPSLVRPSRNVASCDASALLVNAIDVGDCSPVLPSGSTCTNTPLPPFLYCIASACDNGNFTAGVCSPTRMFFFPSFICTMFSPHLSSSTNPSQPRSKSSFLSSTNMAFSTSTFLCFMAKGNSPTPILDRLRMDGQTTTIPWMSTGTSLTGTLPPSQP
jgi:hypothetical protein